MVYVLSIPMLLTFSSCSQRTTTGADRSAVYVPTAAAPGVIPTGTTIAVRTNERIDTEQPVEGRTFEAQVTRSIVGSQNDVLVPEGSTAQLRVVRLEQPGAVGTGELSLALHSLTVGGRTYNVESMPVEVEGQEGLGANRRTATMVGGGAALGTLIGAVAGGAAAQVLTRGDHIRVPAETVLTFQTDQTLRLQGYSR
jgi:hypothetical protein